jgi:hypothetical protein
MSWFRHEFYQWKQLSVWTHSKGHKWHLWKVKSSKRWAINGNGLVSKWLFQVSYMPAPTSFRLHEVQLLATWRQPHNSYSCWTATKLSCFTCHFPNNRTLLHLALNQFWHTYYLDETVTFYGRVFTCEQTIRSYLLLFKVKMGSFTLLLSTLASAQLRKSIIWSSLLRGYNYILLKQSFSDQPKPRQLFNP